MNANPKIIPPKEKKEEKNLIGIKNEFTNILEKKLTILTEFLTIAFEIIDLDRINIVIVP